MKSYYATDELAYEKIRNEELTNKAILIDFEENYDNVLKEDNLDNILAILKNKMKNDQ